MENQVETTTTTTTTEMNEIVSCKEILSEVDGLNNELIAMGRKMKQLLKTVEKQHKVELKDASKRKKKSSNGEKRDPSGFNAKCPVPVEFCEQPWGCDHGQELPRTVLTKMVYDYIKNENLQNPSDKRKINPNSTLKTLFHLKDGDELHFSNFQTYMKRLYDRDFPEDESLSSDADASDSGDEGKKKKTKGKKKGGKKSKVAASNI